MKQYRTALIILVISLTLLLSACQNKDQGRGENPSDPSLSGPETSSPSSNPGEITMEVFFPNVAHLKKAAESYEEKTGTRVNIQKTFIEPVWIEFEIVDKWGDTTTEGILLDPPDMSVYTEPALAGLMAGSGADIYDVSVLDFENLGRNGLLADMGRWLENDADFSDEAYFRNILLSGKTEEGVFAIPIDFTFRRLYATGADEPVLENNRMTWPEFMGEVSGQDYTQEIAYGRIDLDIFMERFISRASCFIDEFGNTESLYSEDMISLLEECREWGEMGLCKGYGIPSSWGAYYSYGTSIFSAFRPAEMLHTLPEEYRRQYNYSAPMLFDGDPVNIDGRNRYPELNDCSSIYGVNAGSPGAEAAQDFLRFLLTEEAQEKMCSTDGTSGSFLPLNRAVFRDAVKSDLKRIQTIICQTTTAEMDIPGLTKKAEETVDEIAYIIFPKPYYQSIIREAAKQFFLGQISSEEAARQMSDKVGLYLKEQG